MRIYIPDGSGLGAREIHAMRRLSRPSLSVLADELGNPASRNAIRRILQSSNPEQALATQISTEIARAVALYHEARSAGLSDYHYDDAVQRHAALGNFSSRVARSVCGLGAVDFRVVAKYGDLSKERKAAAADELRAYQAAKKDKAEVLAAQQAYKAAKKSKDKAAIAAAKQAVQDEEAERKAEIAAAKKAYGDARHQYEKVKLTKEQKAEIVSQTGRAKSGTHWAFYKDNATGQIVATQAKTMKSGNFFSKAGRAIKPYVPVIIGVAGAVLAPFTGGASVAAAAALSAGYSINQKRIQSNKLKRENKNAAKKMQAQVKLEEAALNKQLDDLFYANKELFAAAGITPAAWAGMKVDQKLAVVERINSGQMPSSQENATAAAEAQGAPAPTQTSTWSSAIQSSPIMQQWGEAAGDTDTQTEGVQTPTGVYDVYVEGRKVGTAQTLADASGILSANSKAGDRVEMVLDGKSLGLKIVTAGGGVISVPEDLADRVRSASRDEVDGIIQRATQGAQSSTASSSSGGGLFALLLIGGGALALASGGHK